MTQNKSKIKLETKHSPFTQNKKTLFLKLDSYRNANKHVPASIFQNSLNLYNEIEIPDLFKPQRQIKSNTFKIFYW